MTTREQARWIAAALTILTVVAAVVIVSRSALGDDAAPAAPAQQSPATGPARTTNVSSDLGAVDIYRDWQQRRELAWRKGSTKALASLYVGSEVARSDVRRLRQWRRRGAAGVDLTHQLLACDVVRQRRDDVRVRVTQRLARAVVLSDAPGVELPRGRAQRSEVWLRRIDGVWRVAEVTRLADG